jgi:hypothetical protein
MVSRSLLAVLGVVFASLTPLLGLGTPAHAAAERFTDPNDRTGFDIRAIQVRYGDQLTVRAVHDGKIAVGQAYKFWFDASRLSPPPVPPPGPLSRGALPSTSCPTILRSR